MQCLKLSKCSINVGWMTDKCWTGDSINFGWFTLYVSKGKRALFLQVTDRSHPDAADVGQPWRSGLLLAGNRRAAFASWWILHMVGQDSPESSQERKGT